jgi:hypothetical protein
VLFSLLTATLLAQNTEKILDNGPDGEKLVFVVLGDGYAMADQAKFKADVQKLVLGGVFAHDFYKDNLKAFNVYRVDLVSSQSGVSSLTYKKNTALKVVYSGQWSRCWLEESAATDSLITNAIKVAKYDFVLIMANENGYGGCRRSSRLYITSGDPWDVVAHEYGHGIAGLYDEYSVPHAGSYTGDPVNNNNCSVVKDRNNVVWSNLIDANIDIPSDQAQNIDSNDTVGEFTGCNYAETGIYRPVRACRMNSNTPHFCPVCLALMQESVKGFLGQDSSAPAATSGAAAAPPQGAGSGQQPQGEAAPVINKYVNLIVRLADNNHVTIQKATEITGKLAVAPQASPAFFGALTKDSQPGIASLVVDDPYVVRGFVDPDHKEQGEKLSRAKEATVILHLPQASLAAMHDFGLQFYSVKAAQMPQVRPSQLLNIKPLLDTPAATANVTKVVEVPRKKLSDGVSAAAPY